MLQKIDDTALIAAFIAVWTGQTDKVREPGRFVIKRIDNGVVCLPGDEIAPAAPANELDNAA